MAFGFKNNHGGEHGDADLAGLYTVLADSQAKIAEYLLRCEAQRSATIGTGLDVSQFAAVLAPVLERLDSLGQMMESWPDTLAARIASSISTASVPIAFQESVETSSVSAAPVRPSAPPVPPAPPEVAPEPASGGMSAWECMVFGDGLVNEENISSERRWLLEGLLAGDMASRYFAGIWMMFQASPTEKKALLLKDLGEAFYRWAATLPNGYERFENVFVPWVQSLCEQAGLQNTLERVHVGQRFDNARHTSVSRGVEIMQVHGWVVLRSNGSVYAKALVEVQ